MEESRYWPPIMVLMLFVVGVFCFSYFDKVDKAEVSLETARTQMDQVKSMLEPKQQILASRTALLKQNELLMTRLQTAESRLAAAEKTNATADMKQQTVEVMLRTLTESVRTTAAKNRAELIKTELAEMLLKNGLILKNVKLRKIDDESCSFFHSEGIGSARLADLPADLAEKMDVGPYSISSRLRLLEAEADPSSAAPKADGSGKSQALTSLRKRISDLESRIASVNAHKVKIESEVRDYDMQIRADESRGKNTFNLRTLRDVADGNAGTVRNELLKLEAELKRLQKEEQALVNGPP